MVHMRVVLEEPFNKGPLRICGGFPKFGSCFWRPYSNDYNTLDLYWGPPAEGSYHISLRRKANLLDLHFAHRWGHFSGPVM